MRCFELPSNSNVTRSWGRISCLVKFITGTNEINDQLREWVSWDLIAKRLLKRDTCRGGALFLVGQLR